MRVPYRIFVEESPAKVSPFMDEYASYKDIIFLFKMYMKSSNQHYLLVRCASRKRHRLKDRAGNSELFVNNIRDDSKRGFLGKLGPTCQEAIRTHCLHYL